MSALGRPRNATKADVRVESRDGRSVVVKDYGGRGAPIRWLYGRPTLRREARAYARLAGVEGVVRCLGFDGPDALVLERAPGRSLDRWHAGALPAGIFDALERVLGGIHARGVAIADLHRSNVVIDESGRVHVVDFAMARIAPRAERPGPLVRALMGLDRHAAARLRARARGLPEPRPPGALGRLYRLGRGVKRRL
jgi:hypothetical protein